MYKARWLFFVIAYFGVSIALSACNVTSSNFQADADVYRLKHLEYYAGKIEAYKSKTGYYPFLKEAADIPVYVTITSPQQIDDVQQLPFKHISHSTKTFIDELERGLGNEVLEYYDPQYEPDRKPNFYVYMVHQDRYFLAVHVSQPLSFSQKVAEGYYKVEVSNAPRNDSYASVPQDLFELEEFVLASHAAVSKPDFFKQREQEFLYSTNK